jgi:hypothetical protein
MYILLITYIIIVIIYRIGDEGLLLLSDGLSPGCSVLADMRYIVIPLH